MKKHHKTIGLTGGIGSGKSVAEAALLRAGFSLVDADETSRRLFGHGTDGEKLLIKLFPDADSNGTLDRAWLRRLIAEDKHARRKLNSATHGAIANDIKRQLAALSSTVVLSAPLLFETALSSLCSTTVCIYCPRELRVERIMRRDNISREDAERIIEAQIPDAERCTLADHVVANDGDQNEFVQKIVSLFERLK